MTENVLSSRQMQYVEALLTSRSRKEAAEKVGITPRHARRYMQDPEVRAALAELQDAVLDETADRCASLALEALDVVAAIMQDQANPAGARLMAARLILDNSARLTEQLTTMERIVALEEKVNAQHDEAVGDLGSPARQPAGNRW